MLLGRRLGLLSTASLLLVFMQEESCAVPMVENSVKFALDRCKQFLHLSTFIKDRDIQASMKKNDKLEPQ